MVCSEHLQCTFNMSADEILTGGWIFKCFSNSGACFHAGPCGLSCIPVFKRLLQEREPAAVCVCVCLRRVTI